MIRRGTPFSKKLKDTEIAGWVTTKTGLSISVIKHFNKKKAFLVRIVSTGQSLFIKEKIISSSLRETMKINKVVSIPSGSIIPIELALTLGITYKKEHLPVGQSLSSKVAKGGRYGDLVVKKFLIKRTKIRFSGQRIIDQKYNPTDPDETDDPGPMIKGKP